MYEGDIIAFSAVFLVSILTFFVLGGIYGETTSDEVKTLEKFCTHQNPNLEYNQENMEINDSGELLIKCNREKDRGVTFIMEVESDEE